MAQVIYFPLRLRAALIKSIVDDLEALHGIRADQFWRTRINGIIEELRTVGFSSAQIRTEIMDIYYAIQDALLARIKRSATRSS